MSKGIKILIGVAATLAVGAAVFLRCSDGLKKDDSYMKIQIHKLFDCCRFRKLFALMDNDTF